MYKRVLDRMVGHDYPGVHSHGFVQFEQDEMELGYRAALFINDPEQAWWELIGTPMLKRMEREEANNSRNPNDDSMGGVTPEHLF